MSFCASIYLASHALVQLWMCFLLGNYIQPKQCPERCTWLGLAVVALSFAVRAEGEAQLMCVVRQGFTRSVGAVVGAAVLALVRRAGVGHLHLMAPLRQRLVGFTVHLLHGLKGST